MENEKFCLRWNDFERNISKSFKELRDDKDFFDVTLACDEEQIKAHKIILASCSPFFRNVLRRNPHEQPLLYLKGVKYSDMLAVLNFMYHGEVNVAQEELNSFLAVAEDLKVKGLTQNLPSSKEPPAQTRNLQEKPHGEQKIIRKNEKKPFQRTYEPQPSREDDDIQEVVPIKAEPVAAPLSENHPDTSHMYEPAHQSVVLRGEESSVMTYHDEAGYEDYETYQDQSSYGHVDAHSAGLQETQSGKGKCNSKVTTFKPVTDFNYN